MFLCNYTNRYLFQPTGVFSHSFTQSLKLCLSILLPFKCLQRKKKILNTESFILNISICGILGCNARIPSILYLVLKSFDPLGTHAWRLWSYLHKWMGFCSINMYLCIWLLTFQISMPTWVWNKFICDHKLSQLCFINREKVNVQGLPYVCIQNLIQF